MQEEIAVAEAHHGHACREREGKPHARRRQILERAIDHADVRPERLVSVDRLVERGGCATHVGILPRDAARNRKLTSRLWVISTHSPTAPLLCRAVARALLAENFISMFIEIVLDKLPCYSI